MLILLTAASMVLALIMSVIAWRVSHAERRRSDARVEALAQAIHARPVEAAAPVPEARPAPIVERVVSAERPRSLSEGRTRFSEIDADSPAAEMFAVTARPAGSGSRWGLALAVGAFAVASVAAIAIVFGGDPSTTTIAATPAPAQPPAAPPAAPASLELVALSHDQEADQLTVRGVVRNPAAGTPMERLTAVVSLYTRDGNLLTSTHAAVASPSLIPGGESTFVVTIPVTGAVGRYRIGFRSDEHIISHVDKRTEAATP